MIVRSIFMVLLISLTACCSSKKSSANTQTENDNTMTEEKMIAADFKSGTIVASKAEGDCPYTIKMDGETSYFLDPINLEENYKKDGLKVWFTFTGLRMMNRCEKANPINVNEMRPRE